MNKIIVSILLLLCLYLLETATVSAETEETCPSIDSVHELIHIWPHGPWLPLYAENGELALDVDVKNFSKTAQEFEKAEWSGSFPEMGHCHYKGNAQILLARKMLAPDLKKYSSWVIDAKGKLVECDSSNEDECPYGGIG